MENNNGEMHIDKNNNVGENSKNDEVLEFDPYNSFENSINRLNEIINAFSYDNYMKSITNALDSYKKIFDKYNTMNYYENIMNNISKSYSELIYNNIFKVENDYSTIIKYLSSKINNEPAVKEYKEAYVDLAIKPNDADKAKDFSEKLANMLWIYPLGMNISDLEEITSLDDSEEAVDNYLYKYFSDDKVEKMFKYINDYLEGEQRTFFAQIIKAFNDENYNLAVMGMLSIIDERMTFFIKTKTTTKRKNLFKALADTIQENTTNISQDIIELKMINRVIDNIYVCCDNYESIIFKKKINRHIIMHGKGYVKEKIEAINIINLLHRLIYFIKKFEVYDSKFDMCGKEFKYVG